jgi:hypothetical protein
MKHEKTFDAIGKLKDIELELHRLKNALEMANKGLDAQRQWVGLTDEEIEVIGDKVANEDLVGLVSNFRVRLARAIEQALKELNK